MDIEKAYIFNMEDANDYGVVYVLTNPVMPGLVKIGMTKRGDVGKRMRELYKTGVPVPFECEYACKVNHNVCHEIEQALHKVFEKKRINDSREFFKVAPEKVIPILQVFSKGEITVEIREQIHKRRPPLDYRLMGIAEDEELTYDFDPSVTVKVVSNKKVSYNGEEMSLTAVTKQIMGVTRELQPTTYWSYRGRNLKDIYEETFKD